MKRKTGYGTLLIVLTLILTMSAGCGKKENRYTYRDNGIKALSEGNYKDAIQSFDQAIDTKKGLVGKFDMDVLKYRAEAEYLSGDYQAAVGTYDILIKVDGEKPEYYNMRSASKAGAGDDDGAIADYNRSNELDPDGKAPGRMNALMAAGAAMEKAGSASDAMKLYESAAAGGEAGPMIYNRMGLSKMAQKDWDGALESFQKGLSAPEAKTVPELLFNIAVVYERKGEFKKALDTMEQYVSAHGPDEEAQREITFLESR
ncbi:tetratricopeptide repeat protein [Lacrimispora xylanisolvens]|uniref:tetratricopeptide repeat protein n=1 Tax=Lacrimispora xylanisolvens TaxID=384636 RepID=UPI00240276FE|nr:tetratricopeptide repeat protein [Paenibacillaceae bacterium]